MYTLYFPLVLSTHVPTQRPFPILLLKVNPDQAALALRNPQHFVTASIRFTFPVTIDMLMKLGFPKIPKHEARVRILTPDIAQKFTALVETAPAKIIALFSVDISGVDLLAQEDS